MSDGSDIDDLLDGLDATMLIFSGRSPARRLKGIEGETRVHRVRRD
ncbi:MULTISPECIES: hypothetical protein [Mycobacterium]|nr:MULTISPECIES: hypothetical protein [Mycobacterium]